LLNKTAFNYDATGLLSEVVRADTSTTTNVYDSRNLLEQTIDPMTSPTRFAYDDAKRLTKTTDPLNRSVSVGYDADGRATSAKTQLAYTTVNTLDVLGQKTKTTDAANKEIKYTYDKDGRIRTLTNRLEKVYEWTYSDDLLTTTNTTPLTKRTVSVLNSRGLQSSLTPPSGSQTTFDSYDDEGRLLQKTDGEGVTTLTYYANGLLKDVTEGGHTTHREYDDFDRLKSYQDGEGNTIGYNYDKASNLIQISYPSSTSNPINVNYAYDSLNRLHTVTDWANRITTYTYDALGRVKNIARPNGTATNLIYDAASQLKRVEEYNPQSVLSQLQALQYDADGRINWQLTSPAPGSFTVPPDVAVYDADNRLSTWQGNAVSHDDNGNMTYGPLPDGNMGIYVYDTRNRLKASPGQTYRYNPDGNRVEVSGTQYLIDPNAALSRASSAKPRCWTMS